MNKRRYSKNGRNPNNWEKLTSKPLLEEEANLEEIVETNQLLTDVNNLIEPLTISADKVELNKLAKDWILPAGFRVIDLSILSDVLSLLVCPNCSTITEQQILWNFKTLKTRKKDLQYLCKSNVETMNSSIPFILYLRLTAANTIVAEKWKLCRSTVGLYTVSKVSKLVLHQLLNCVISWTYHQRMTKNAYDGLTYSINVASK